MTARKVIGCMRPDGGADCEITLGCSGCHRAIYEFLPPAAHHCVSHHNACDCREHKVAVLIKAALDGAAALDDLREAAFGDPHAAPIDAETNDRLQQIVDRAYAACEELGVQIGAPCECASCGKEEVMA